MTTPNSASPAVAENNHLSACNFCGIAFKSLCNLCVPLCLCGELSWERTHHRVTEIAQRTTETTSNIFRQTLDFCLKYSSPMLETLEHIKAGAGRREQDRKSTRLNSSHS